MKLRDKIHHLLMGAGTISLNPPATGRIRSQEELVAAAEASYQRREAEFERRIKGQ